MQPREMAERAYLCSNRMNKSRNACACLGPELRDRTANASAGVLARLHATLRDALIVAACSGQNRTVWYG